MGVHRKPRGAGRRFFLRQQRTKAIPPHSEHHFSKPDSTSRDGMFLFLTKSKRGQCTPTSPFLHWCPDSTRDRFPPPASPLGSSGTSPSFKSASPWTRPEEIQLLLFFFFFPLKLKKLWHLRVFFELLSHCLWAGVCSERNIDLHLLQRKLQSQQPGWIVKIYTSISRP